MNAISDSTSPAVSTRDAKDGSASPVQSVVDAGLRLRTKFAFALVTCLGGLLLGTGDETGPLAIIVISFALIGLICVDWLELFSLPALVAYCAMGLTAIVCIADFAQDSVVLTPKMVAVAQLLAVAQAILMLQQKSHRLFEQLLTFALLNCIVAAVFNDAFSYAIWFFPLAIAAGLSLALLAADETVSRAGEVGRDAAGMPLSGFVRYDNRAAMGSFVRVARRLSWTSMFLLVPAITAIAAVIFFALPRRIDAQRGAATAAMVGFSNTVRLGEIGRMQMSQDRAMRVKLTDPGKGNKPYPTTSSLYLRGLVLEHYVASQPAAQGSGSWQNLVFELADERGQWPVRFSPSRVSDSYFYDRVHVEVRCDPMRSAALFSIAPYHRIIGSERISQDPLKWTFSRRLTELERASVQHDNIEYHFGTQGFRDGIQTSWIYDLSLAPIHEDVFDDLNQRREETGGGDGIETPHNSFDSQVLSAEQQRYLDELLDYPEAQIPSARVLADAIVDALPPQKRNPVEIAQRLEQYLSQNDDFDYTLNLDQQAIEGMDPLEQFLRIDRRGHCQYFASALAMMLRSQGIPARLVVGFHCDEFNNLGQYFVVRQSHAHAWVEALIDRKDIPPTQNIYGQPESKRYWLRLDPTPGGGGVPESGAFVGGRKIAELARNIWHDYIIQMNPERQGSPFQTSPVLAPMSNSYRTWIDRAKSLAMQFNSDEFQWSSQRRPIYAFAVVAAIVLCGVIAVFLRRYFPILFPHRRAHQSVPVARPSIAFYSETLELLERVGYARLAGQTPAELTAKLSDERVRSPASVLQQLFYRIRYGAEDEGADHSNQETVKQSLASLRAGVEQSARDSSADTSKRSGE